MNYSKNISNNSKRYSGYWNTPLLWHGQLEGLEQLELPCSPEPKFDSHVNKQLRLGHLVEHFVESEFLNRNDIEILAKNLQIEDNSRTLGEFDFIINNKGAIQHIEVVYKFYLRDTSISSDSIKQWIGPNRNDSLIQKIHKIKTSQFPLIKNSCSADKLQELGITPSEVEQKVFFKGQLFTSPNDPAPPSILNEHAIAGKYYRYDELKELGKVKIHIPNKHDWLIQPHANVNWIESIDDSKELHEQLADNRSPMIWIKEPNGVVSKAFVVCW